jgi:hypothetical protein
MKSLLIFTGIHGVISQKTEFFIILSWYSSLQECPKYAMIIFVGVRASPYRDNAATSGKITYLTHSHSKVKPWPPGSAIKILFVSYLVNQSTNGYDYL